MKILVIRYSSLSEVILTTPVVRNLKTQLKDVEVHYLTERTNEPILAENPYIDQLHFAEKTNKETVAKLAREKFEYVIDLEGNSRTKSLRSVLGGNTLEYDRLKQATWLMVHLKINKLPNIHVVDRFMQAVEPLGVKMDDLGLDYFIPEKDEVELSWLPETHSKEYIALAIGGDYQTRKLPEKRLIELCDRINKPIVLIGDAVDNKIAQRVENFFRRNDNDAETEEKLHKGLNKKALIFNACGKFNINQMASIIKQARAVFTHENATMHMAAAFKKQVFSIWGNTIPAFGTYPFRTKFTVFENNRVGCRPCTHTGFGKCPKGHFKCMNDIVFDFYLP